MRESSIYKDIAKRTGGDIYIGVVGPVRTGKSTFIGRFLDCVVIPNIENGYDKARTLDEMPQGASGRTVMTTEPKFVPDDAVKIKIEGECELEVKLIDCVGYMVDGALGTEEDGVPRMIMTPWSDTAIPFSEAAELGTSKVIGEHATIGMLVTTDGTITDIPREAYLAAEERVAKELKDLGKPFAIVLNSKYPESESARSLAEELECKYGVPVALVSCTHLNADDIKEILGLVLGEFPVRRLDFRLPRWTGALEPSHPLRQKMYGKINEFADAVMKIGDITDTLSKECGITVSKIDAGEGVGELTLPLSDEVYYETLSEVTGLDIRDEENLFSVMKELSHIKEKHDKIKDALSECEEKGYGIVIPGPEEMSIEEPRVVKQPGGYGVKMTAHAETIHMIRAGIRADICPVVGSSGQSEEVVKSLVEEYESSPKSLWSYELFGRSMYELVKDGMSAKLSHIPDDAREKLGETLERIINEGASGLICILL